MAASFSAMSGVGRHQADDTLDEAEEQSEPGVKSYAGRGRDACASASERQGGVCGAPRASSPAVLLHLSNRVSEEQQ